MKIIIMKTRNIVREFIRTTRNQKFQKTTLQLTCKAPNLVPTYSYRL